MGQQGKTPKCFSIIFYMTDCKQFKSLSLLNFRNRTSCAISSRINGLSFYTTLCPLSLYSHYHPLKHPTCLICQVGNTPCDPQLPPCWAVPQFCLLWAEENWNHKFSAVCPLLRCQISQKTPNKTPGFSHQYFPLAHRTAELKLRNIYSTVYNFYVVCFFLKILYLNSVISFI